MKLASVLTLLALGILPGWTSVVVILVRFARKGYKGVDALIQPSPKPMASAGKKKRIAYVILSGYMVALLGSVLWVFLQFVPLPPIDPQLAAFILWSGVMLAAIFAWMIYYSIRRTQAIHNKLPPPKPGADESEVLQWRNKYADEVEDSLLKTLGITMLGAIASVAVWLVGFFLIAIMFNLTR